MQLKKHFFWFFGPFQDYADICLFKLEIFSDPVKATLILLIINFIAVIQVLYKIMDGLDLLYGGMLVTSTLYVDFSSTVNDNEMIIFSFLLVLVGRTEFCH